MPIELVSCSATLASPLVMRRARTTSPPVEEGCAYQVAQKDDKALLDHVQLNGRRSLFWMRSHGSSQDVVVWLTPELSCSRAIIISAIASASERARFLKVGCQLQRNVRWLAV